MARNNATTNAESLGDLYARIGLNFDEMENGFIDVERTLRQNLGRLNRENRIITLQTQVDLEGLDDAEQILQTRTRGLQRQLNNQRQRLNLLEAQLQDTARATGENSDATQRARIEYEQTRLSVARLESQLEDLNNQSQDINLFGSQAGLVDKFNKLFSVASNLAEIYNTVNDAVNNLIDSFKELKTQGAAFNLPLNQIDDFARKIRLAGGELEDVGGYLRGLTDALIKGEVDDAEYIALKKYGESIFTATGQLKSYVEIWEAVHRAYKKAAAEGNEINFLQMTGGESGVTDAKQALDNWEKAQKIAAEISKAKLDFSEIEKATDTSNKLSEQIDELEKAIGKTFQPFTTAAAEGFFNVLKKGTDIVNDLNDSFDRVRKDYPTPFADSFLDYRKKLFEFEKKDAKDFIIANRRRNAELKKQQEDQKKQEEEQKKRQEEQNELLQQYAIQRTQDLKDNIADLRVEIDYENEYLQAVKQAQIERERALRQTVVSKDERAAIEEKFRTDLEKAEKDHNDKLEDMAKETAAIQYEATHSAYQKEIWEIEQWKQKALEDLGEYKDAIGNKNQWLKESAEITAQALAKELKAYEDEIDRIKGKQLTLAEKFFKKTHSQADWDIYQAEKEAQQMLDEGIYHPADILEMLGMEVGDIEKRARKDKAYRAEPEINFALPDIDYYGQITDLVDEVMEGYTALSRAQKDALGLFNIPDKVDYKNPFGEAQESLKLADLLADDFARADKAVNDFVDTVNDAQIKFDDEYVTTETSTQPYKSGGIGFKPAEDFKFVETSSIDEKIKLAAQKLKAADKPNINLPASKIELPRLDNIAAEIAELTRTAGTIANTVTQRQAAKQQQQIVINLSPNIDLGGAYVFDNALKLELTNDITAEVANAVKDAVQMATVNLIPN